MALTTPDIPPAATPAAPTAAPTPAAGGMEPALMGPPQPAPPRAVSVAGPIPDFPMLSSGDVTPADTQPEFIPPAVQNSIFKTGVMSELHNEPSDQAFDTAVRLSAGDLKGPLMAFKGISPDVAAQVDQLAKSNGTTFGLANRAKDGLEMSQEARNIVASLSATDDKGNFIYPNVIKWIQDPVNLAKSKDDIDALKGVEDIVRQRQQAGESSWIQTVRGAAAGIERSVAGLLKIPAAAYDTANAGLQQLGNDSGPIGSTLNDLS